MAKPTRTTN